MCNKNDSLIFLNEVILPPLKNGKEETILIELEMPGELPMGDYKIIINFNVKGKNYGEPIILNIKIVTEVEAFKKRFNLEDIFSDQDILEALQKSANWDYAFEYLINK